MGPVGGQLASSIPKAKKRKMNKDPNRPKRSMSAYFMYARKVRQDMAKRGEKITRVADFTKEVSAQWRTMTPYEKTPYDQLAAQDKARYDAEMAIYKGKAAKDVNKPKKPQTAYFLWLAGWRERMKGKYDHKDLLRQAGVVWSKMSDQEKDPFNRRSEEEKRKYEEAMKVYNAGGGAMGVAKVARPDLATNMAPMAAQYNGGGASHYDDNEEEDDEDDDDEEDDDE